MQHYLIPRKIALICAAVFLLLIVVNTTGMVRIDKLMGAIPVFCPFKAITGIACPGCGMTRAITSLIEGEPGNAALYNPFCFFLLSVLLMSILPMHRLRPPVRARLEHVLPVFYAVALSLVLTFWVFDRLLPQLH